MFYWILLVLLVELRILGRSEFIDASLQWLFHFIDILYHLCQSEIFAGTEAICMTYFISFPVDDSVTGIFFP